MIVNLHDIDLFTTFKHSVSCFILNIKLGFFCYDIDSILFRHIFYLDVRSAASKLSAIVLLYSTPNMRLNAMQVKLLTPTMLARTTRRDPLYDLPEAVSSHV